MPGLLAIISANAEPMRRELQAVERMSRDAGNAIQRNLQGNGGAHAKSGVITETLVLMRELSRGNFTRVPGSLTILLQRMGVLKLLMGGTADAANVLAQAWATQAEAAGLAATAAVRKAAASSAAFYADEAETEATLAQAVADEEGAAAAILNAKAMQQKAIAASEAAAASKGGTGAAAVGSVGIVASVVIGLVAGMFAAYKLSNALKDRLSELKFPDFHPEYIANHLKAINRSAEAQKEINKEVQKTIDLYNSASKAAERVASVTKEHYDHLRKMNQYEKDPVKKAARELEIDRQERNAELSNKMGEQLNLDREAKRKKAEADKLGQGLTSEAGDKSTEAFLKGKKDFAKKYLEDLETADFDNKRGSLTSKEKEERNAARDRLGRGHESIVNGYNSIAASGVSAEDLEKAQAANKQKALDAIKAADAFENTKHDNDVKREKVKDLYSESGKSASKAAELALDIPNQAKINAQKNSDEADEKLAELHDKQKTVHGSVNELQRIGAYAAPATIETIARSQLTHLRSIDNKIDKMGGGGSSGHRPQF